MQFVLGFDFGFEDVYIEEYIHEEILYWRVRTGIFNSKIKVNKHNKKGGGKKETKRKPKKPK